MWKTGMTEKSAALTGYWKHEVRLFGMTVAAPQAEDRIHDAETQANKFTKLLSLPSAKSYVHRIFKLLS